MEKEDIISSDNNTDVSLMVHLLVSRISNLELAKRTFNAIRALILFSLIDKRLTINQISKATSVNWKTVENHLTHLIGKGLVREVHSSEYVRIIELTEKGRECSLRLKERLSRSLIENKADEDIVEILNKGYLK